MLSLALATQLLVSVMLASQLHAMVKIVLLDFTLPLVRLKFQMQEHLQTHRLTQQLKQVLQAT